MTVRHQGPKIEKSKLRLRLGTLTFRPNIQNSVDRGRNELKNLKHFQSYLRFAGWLKIYDPSTEFINHIHSNSDKTF